MSDILNPNGATSSKRIAGFVLIGVLCAESLFIIWKHPEFIPNVLQAITWGICVCFGATAVEKIPGIGK